MRRKTIPSRRAVHFYMSEGTGDEALECLGVWSTAGKERRGRLYSSPGPGLGRDSELRYARSRNGLVSASDTCTGLEKLATIVIGASSDRLSSFVWGIGRTMGGRGHHPCSLLARPKNVDGAPRTLTGEHTTQCAVTSWTRAHVTNMASLVAPLSIKAAAQRSKQ
jgi:hypothetical protein